ncbi:uncharacterized protein LAESUDRAFT_720305 [Laetiporus sulphureus 93-53]|uniref:Uncharacterized protein n=1 Tax=Laetiporus sulphureus 93-53 TaxID=1314785 RepID=A0A165H1Q3_9APHY|nr:uncharacterized protein LAESUDRAFT_720305 [Laetiporus sulphureus 93-53]KZT11121.1 hypothetical protein LAESUDRAFT_720305 [Laetiporus sulphureus 93-53]
MAVHPTTGTAAPLLTNTKHCVIHFGNAIELWSPPGSSTYELSSEDGMKEDMYHTGEYLLDMYKIHSFALEVGQGAQWLPAYVPNIPCRNSMKFMEHGSIASRTRWIRTSLFVRRNATSSVRCA